MRSLFDGTLATHDDIKFQQIDTLGRESFPDDWVNTWESRQKFLNDAGQPKQGRTVFPVLETAFEEEI